MRTVTITESTNDGLDVTTHAYNFRTLDDAEEFTNWLVAYYTEYEKVSGGVLGDWKHVTLYFGSRDNFVTIVTTSRKTK